MWKRIDRMGVAALIIGSIATAASPAAGQDRRPLDPVIVGEPVDGTFTYCVHEQHLREMATFESQLAARQAGRGAFVDRFGARKRSECGFAPFQDLVFLEKAFAWRGYDVDGEPTDWEAWEVETAEWGLHLFVVIERGWVWLGPPI